MNKMDSIILGVNHMFLYPESMSSGAVHTQSLAKLAENPLVDALDCWVWADNKTEELAILRNCGKQINYNIGDRIGEAPAFPASADPKERAHAMEILKREKDFALEGGAKKIIFSSGRDVPRERNDAIARYIDFVMEWCEDMPKEICLTLEPGDQDLDKFLLMGNLEDSCYCVKKLQERGLNIGILLDMGHVPQLHETLESAVEKTGSLLRHIHLGNCILKNPQNPLYGDKHVCWGAEDGEYDEHDGTRFMRLLYKSGYFHRGEPQTISFEMRPLTGLNSEQSLEYLVDWYKRAISEFDGWK